MKIVFNFNFRVAASLRASVILGVAIFVLTALAPAAAADTTYFTTRQVLKDFFPQSDTIGFEEYAPNAAERKVLKRRLGYALSRSNYYIYVAKTDGRIDGYAFIDDQMGQHQPITFAVKLSPKGVVLKQEVMVYRETRGDEVRTSRFKKQFKGKTLHDPLRPNKDIDCVSGATISSRAITLGVRRALVLFDAAITARQALRVSQASHLK